MAHQDEQGTSARDIYKDQTVESLVAASTEKREAREQLALLAWSNTFLSQRSLKANTLQDFRDGVLLANLCEATFQKKLGKYSKRPKLPIQKLENVEICFAFLKQQEVRLISIDTHHVTAGKEKQLIIILWNILRKILLTGLGFAEESKDGKKIGLRTQLLEWCQKTFSHIDNLNIADFWGSFRDGVAFCAIVDSLVPGQIDLATLDPEQGESNLDLAFTVAEDHLQIPRLLDPSDFDVGKKPDERGVMNYLSMLLSTAQSESKKKILEAKYIAEKEAAKARLVEEREEAAARVEEERLRLEEKANEAAALQAALEEAETKRAAEESKFRGEQAKLEEAMAEAKKRIEDEQAKAAEAANQRQSELEAEAAKRAEEQAAYDELQQSMEQAASLADLEKQRNLALEEDTKQLQEAYRALQEDSITLREAHVHLQGGTKKLRAAYVQLQGKQDDLQKKHDGQSDDLAHLREEYLAAQENIMELRAAWDQSEADLGQMRQKLATSMDEANDLRAKLAEALAKLAKAEERERGLRADIEELKTLHEHEKAEAEKELFAVQAQLYKMHREHEEVMSRIHLDKADSAAAARAANPNLAGEKRLKTMEEKLAMAIRERKSDLDFISMMKNMEGYLQRRRPNAVFHKQRFKKVFFRMQGLKLSYYKDHVSEKKAGPSFPLADYREAMATSSIPGHFTFKLVPKEADGSNTVLELKGAEVRRKDPRASIMASAQASYFAGEGEDDKDLDGDIKTWMYELNRRIALDGYLREVEAGTQPGCKEILDFVCDDSQTELRVDDKMVGVHEALVSLKLALQHRANLKVIYMRNVALSDHSVAVIADIIKVNPQVEKVLLPDNMIGKAGAVFLAEALKLNKSLATLDLSNNQLKDEGIEVIAGALAHHPTLFHMSLTGNGITDKGATALINGLRDSTKANFGKPHRFPAIELQYNLIGDETMTQVAQFCAENRTVHRLNFANNLITDKGVKILCEAICEQNTSISFLDISGNSVSTKGMLALNDAMSSVTHELVVDFSNNKLIARSGIFALVNNTELQMDYQLFKVHKLGEEVFDPVDTADVDFAHRAQAMEQDSKRMSAMSRSPTNLGVPGASSRPPSQPGSARVTITGADFDSDEEEEKLNRAKAAEAAAVESSSLTVDLSGGNTDK